MIQVNRIYLIFNRLVTKKFLVDTSESGTKMRTYKTSTATNQNFLHVMFFIVP